MSNPFPSSHQLLINLSYCLSKPTGTTTYILNLLPYLRPLAPTLLTSQPIPTGLTQLNQSCPPNPPTLGGTGVQSPPELGDLGGFREKVRNSCPNYSCHLIPSGLTPEQGLKGHLRRLVWTQLQLPQICKQQQSPLLFSPIPEAPLFTNTRYVVTVHDLIPLRFPNPRSPLTPYFRYYIPQVLAQAQHILCDSVATAKDITKFFQIPVDKITPILLAHDAKDFRFLDLPTSNYFLYIGRHDSYKNLHRLIDAFAALPNNQDYELWIAGPTDRRYTPNLQAQAESLSLNRQVKFLDYVPYAQLPTIISQAIALVFPTLWEGFGLPVLEAMACGTPVITSNLASLPEVVGDAALLINPYNPGEITEAMQALVTDSVLRSHLRTLSLNQASQFSWEKTGLATMKVLKQYL